MFAGAYGGLVIKMVACNVRRFGRSEWKTKDLTDELGPLVDVVERWERELCFLFAAVLLVCRIRLWSSYGWAAPVVGRLAAPVDVQRKMEVEKVFLRVLLGFCGIIAVWFFRGWLRESDGKVGAALFVKVSLLLPLLHGIV